ncbi:MAG: long-chain fatty acid--CoA ligase [bacterium]|nr:long-chain fatty acid--CoA ligase [bacterium]
MALALASILAESALRRPGRTALICGTERITYAQLWDEARRYGALFRRYGVGPGDRVAILLPNVPDFPRAYYGALAIGAVVVPVHALLTADEIAYVLQDSGAKVLVAHPLLLAAGAAGAERAGVPCVESAVPADEPVPMLVQREVDDDAVILYTSGTTGKPKGAVLSQSNMLWNANVSAFDLFDVSADDVFLGCLPLFHSFGQTCVMNAAFRVGASVVLQPRFDGPGALDLMLGHGVTVFAGVPTMYIGLLDAAKANAGRPPLRHAVSGGASLPLAVIEAFEQMYGVEIYEGYGLSETSPVASFNQREFGRRPGTVGCGVWGVDLGIARAEVDDRIELLPPGELGEIVIRGHCVFKGYLNKPEATREAIVDGWFRSGDLGTKDADGFITIVDRKKDMILRGGFNVYPREVEEVLMRHPAVKQVAVIGVPHDTHGEEIVAVIVRTETAGEVTSEAVIAWSQEHLGRYKYPRHVHFVEAMPLGPSGKVLKRELKRTLVTPT